VTKGCAAGPSQPAAVHFLSERARLAPCRHPAHGGVVDGATGGLVVPDVGVPTVGDGLVGAVVVGATVVVLVVGVLVVGVTVDGEGLGVEVGEAAEVVGAGVLGADDGVVPCTGVTRLGVLTWRPVSRRTIASAATAVTATALPVAIPAANARRSRRYSVRRRSRSQAGRAARRAAQLL
jgi:hypothetical protein